MRLKDPFRLLSVVVLLFSLNCLNATQPIIPLLDSLMNSGAYQEIIALALKDTETADLSGLDQAARWLYAARAYYKISDFPACWEAIQNAYQIAQQLDLGSDREAELAVDIAQTLGGYAFVAFEYSAGLAAADFSLYVIQNFLCNDPELLTRSYLRKIVLHRGNSELDTAVAYVKKAKDAVTLIVSDDISSDLKITILAEEAQLQSDQYQLRSAINTYQEIIDLAQALKDTNRLMVYYNNIGIAYFKMGDFGRSESALNKSLQYKLNYYHEYSPSLISNYSNLALVNVWQDKHKDAEAYYQRLLKIVTDQYGLVHIRNATTFYNLGYSYYLREKYDTAAAYFHKCLAIRQEKLQGNSLLIADVMNMIGSCANRQGKFVEAKPWLEKALQIRLANGLAKDDVSRDLYTELAEAFYKSGDLSGYKESLGQAYASIKYNMKDAPFDFTGMEVPLGLSDVLKLDIKVKMDQWDRTNDNAGWEIEHLLKVSDSLTQFVRHRFDDIESRRKLISQLKWLHEFELQFKLIRLNAEPSSQKLFSAIHDILEKSKNVFLYEHMADANADELIGMPVVMMERKSVWSDSIVFYQNLLDDGGKRDEQGRISILKSLNNAQDSLDSWFALVKKKYPSYYNALYGTEMVSLQKVQEKLDDGVFILNYFLGEQASYVLLIGATDFKIQSIGATSVIQNQVAEFIEILTSRRSKGELEKLSLELYSLLMPFKELDVAKKLTIIPDGLLGICPFELLRDSNGTLLFDRINIHYQFSSTMTLKSAVRSVKKPKVLVMAPGFEDTEDSIDSNGKFLPEISGHWLGSLPYSLQEAEMVAAVFGGSAWVKEAATKSLFKKQSRMADIIHLATHGVVNHDRPGRSRLYFYDDHSGGGSSFIYANEIVNMKLQAALLVLSACNTGIGRVQTGEGIASLGRAFAYAGAAHQVLSLWPVNDHTTSEIMSYFYANLQEGMGKATALYEAKKTYIREAPEALKDPYYWAGLVYYGDDVPLIQKRSSLLWYVIGCIGLIVFALFILTTRNKTSATQFF